MNQNRQSILQVFSMIFIFFAGLFLLIFLFVFPYGEFIEAIKGPDDIREINIADINDDKIYYFDHLKIIGTYAKVVNSSRIYYVGVFQDGEGKNWFISVDPQLDNEIKEELDTFFDDAENGLDEYDLSAYFSLISLDTLKTRYRTGFSIGSSECQFQWDENDNRLTLTDALENIDTFFQDACDIYGLFYSADALYFNADYITSGEMHTLSNFFSVNHETMIMGSVSFAILTLCIVFLIFSKKQNFAYIYDNHQGVYSQNKADRKSRDLNSKKWKAFRRGKSKSSPNSSFSGWPNNKKSVSPALVLAEGLFERFNEKGLTKYLTVDYSGPDYTSFHLYSVDGKIVFSQDAHRELNLILVSIMKHLDLPPFVNLIIQDDSGTIIKGPTDAGSYTNRAQERTITVKIKEYFQPSNIVAILCHECTHFFMEYHELNVADKQINEQRTDVVANLIGFNKIMSYGYRPIITTQVNGNTQRTTTHKIGYISDLDCVEIGRFLENCRVEIKSRQAAAQKYDDLKLQCEQLLETAKTFAHQLEAIDIYNVKTSTPDQILKIQQVLLEKESINIDAEIQRHEQFMNNCTEISQFEREKTALDQLCMTFLSWLNVLQGQ